MTSPVLVFLHIPKTAGQTVHAALTECVGSDHVSPIRVHTQVPKEGTQMPAGYSLYSGHIDWGELDDLPKPRKAFTVLRDPLERIASFYFYLRRKADAASEDDLKKPENTGLKRVQEWDAGDYFFAGDPSWKRFIHDHYWNPFCSYLTTRKIRGASEALALSEQVLLDRATQSAAALDGVYHIGNLEALETDLQHWTGHRPTLVARKVNSAPTTGRRWPELKALLSQTQAERVRNLVVLDQQLMRALGFPIYDWGN